MIRQIASAFFFKSWLIQTFQIFDCVVLPFIGKQVEQYYYLVFIFTQFLLLESVFILDLAQSGLKGLRL